MTLWIFGVVLFLLAELVVNVTYTVKPMFSGANADTLITRSLSLQGGYYYEYSNGLKAFGYSTDYTSGAIKLFYNSGTKIASYNYPVSQQVAFTLVMKDPLKMFTIQNYTLILSFKLTLNSGVYTISPDAFTRDTKLGDVNNRYLKGIEKPTTSYIFFATNGQYSRAIRYDSSNNLADYRTGTMNNPGLTTYYIGLFGALSNYYLKTTDKMTTETYDLVTLELVKLITTTTLSVMGLVDNLSKELYFRGTSSNGIKSFNMTADMAGGTSHVAVSTTTVNGNYIPFFNLGSFQYFGVSPVYTKFLILSKLNLATAHTSITLSIMYYSPIGSQEDSSRAYFGFVRDSDSYFQTYYLDADSCVTRVSTTCTVCDSGLYRSSTSPNNYCLLPSQFPAGFGPNTVSMVMTACTTPNCANCLSDYAVCSGCSTTYLAYSGSCYLPQNLPVGVGVNPASNTTAAACLTSGCNNCSLDYNTCVECSSGKYLYSGSCISSASIPSGYGVSSPSNTVVPCATPACSACQANFSVCTACTSPKYLLNNICYSASSLPSGYGVNTTLNTVVSCAEVNCADCSTNASTCTTCKSGYNQLADACVQTVPDHYGFDNATSTLKPCQVTGCKTCASNFQVCTSCDPTRYLLSNACVTSAGIPAGYGVNTSSNTVVGCSGSGCADCTSDYSVCSGCVANRYLLNGVCYTSAGIPAGYGVNTSSNTSLKPCATPHCGSCEVDSSVCVQCGGGYYLLNNTCYDAGSIPPKYGIDGATLKSCSAPNCQTCSASYSTCTSCASSYYEINISGAKSCVTMGNIPPGYGITSGYTLAKCDDSVCIECKNNVSECNQCSSNQFVFVDHCEHPSAVSDGFGVDQATGRFVGCSDSHCVDCHQDYKTCNSCDQPIYFNFQGACITSGSIPLGKGIDSTTNSVVECKDSNCKDCRANNSECQECKSSVYLLDENHLCAINSKVASSDCSQLSPACSKCFNGECLECQNGASSEVEIIQNKCFCFGEELDRMDTKCDLGINLSSYPVLLMSATWQASKISALLKFNRATSSPISKSGFKVTLSDKENTYVLEDSAYTFQDDIDSSTITLRLNREYDIDNGELTIRQINKMSYFVALLDYFQDYPVVVRDISMLSGGQASRMMQQTAKPRAVMADMASIILMVQGANTAAMSDKMVNNFLYFRFLNGPTMYYTELIFDFLSQSALESLDLVNPLQKYSDNENIQIPTNYERRRVQANLYFNYGLDMMFLYGLLVISSVISYSSRFTRYSKPVDKQPSTGEDIPGKSEDAKTKVIKYVQQNFGMRLVISKLMGSMMEIVCYGLLNIFSLQFSFPMVIGLLQSLIFIVYFGGCGILTYRIARSSNREQLLGERLEKIQNTKLSAFSAVYEGYFLNLKGPALFMPLVDIIRSLAIHSLLFLLNKFQVAQVATILAIELPYLCYIIQFRVKTSTMEYFLDILNAGCCVIFGIGQLANNFITSGYARQRVLGLILGGIMVVTILLNLIFIMVLMIKTAIITPIKHYLKQRSLAKVKNQTLKKDGQRKRLILNRLPSNIKGNAKDLEKSIGNNISLTAMSPSSPFRKKFTFANTALAKESNLEMVSPGRSELHSSSKRETIVSTPKKSGMAKFEGATKKFRMVKLMSNNNQKDFGKASWLKNQQDSERISGTTS